MPTIPITNALGLDVDGKLQPDAKMLSILPRFLQLQNLPLDQVPIDEAGAGLNFAEPINVPCGELELRAGAGAGGKLSLVRAGRKTLDSGDPFDAVAVAADEMYVAVELHFSGSTDASAGAGAASLGLSLEGRFSITCYRRFRKGPGGFPAFGAALAQTFSAFALPKTVAEVLAVPEDAVVVLAGGGTLNVSGDFSLSMPVESLASVAVSGIQVLQVKPAASLNLGADVEIEGDYQVRLRRSSAATVELGVYGMKSRSLSVHVSAQAGVSASVAGFDLGERVVGALSTQPAVDVAEFRKALPGEDDAAKDARIAGWQSSLNGAISTKLQASIAASFSTCKSNEALWQFHIDPARATSTAAGAAILRALAGDFSLLTARPPLPAGIEQVQNVLTATSVAKQSLRINLIGMVTALSVVSIAQTSTVELDASGGVTLITDTSSASRLRALLATAGHDSRRLRKMLSENFLVEAVYHVANLGVLPPEFKARHTFFSVEENTDRDKMRDYLDVPRVLGLITRAQQESRLGTHKEFGAATLYAELKYDGQAVRRLFLDNAGKARTVDEYETLGRSALGALLAGDAGQAFRQRYADLGMAGSELWRQMKQTGNTRLFGPLFGLPLEPQDPRIGAVGADYVVITDWAQAMHGAGAAVSEILAVTAGAPAASDSRFSDLHDRLKSKLTAVVAKTHDEFGDPLGLVMVYLAAGQDALKTVQLTGDQIQPLQATPAAAVQSAGG